MKKTAYAKWFVDGSREQVERMIKEGAFFIQFDKADSLSSDDGVSKVEFNQVSGGKLDGSYEVILTGDVDTTDKVMAPGWNADVEDCEYCRCLDDHAKDTGEAYDFGFLKAKKAVKK